jgi:NAD-reducing hydrogenase small subunit
MSRPRIATVSLCGCFGCHMSLLDLDERLVELAAAVEFARSPINDIKELEGSVDVGLVEGGCANEENVRVLREFRARCRLLVAVGDCAIQGGVPALRNLVPLAECLEEAYVRGASVDDPRGRPPADPELPLLLDRVCPLDEVVRIDHHLPGCPPSADALWAALTALLAGRAPELTYQQLRYD